MKTFKALLTLCLAMFLAASARADDCCDRCDHCGCQSHCGKVCRVICDKKKVTTVTYRCECEDFCVPGPSKKCGTHCECEPDCCSPCGKICKKVTDWLPTCAQVRTKHKLIKHETTKEVPSYKWVVENRCEKCGGGGDGMAPSGGKDAAPAPTPAPTKPAPKNAKVGDEYPLSEAELKQVSAVLPATVLPATGKSANRIATQEKPQDRTPWSLFTK
jgi:hypothetical protein